MKVFSIGFIGAGRIARILLGGWSRAGVLPASITAADRSEQALELLRKEFPTLTTVQGDNRAAARQDIVFIALHPPAIRDCLEEIRDCLAPGAVVVSLAPKLTLQQLSQGLGGHQKIIRMIPNAPSIVSAGYNPVTFSPAFSEAEKAEWLAWFRVWGEVQETEEGKLEAYAILTAMGPTYLWFQLYELISLSRAFGLDETEAIHGAVAMTRGAIETLACGEFSPEQVMDLIPVKPLGEAEAGIKEAYHRNLEPLYQKLKN